MYFMLNKADDVFQDLEVLKAVPKTLFWKAFNQSRSESLDFVCISN